MSTPRIEHQRPFAVQTGFFRSSQRDGAHANEIKHDHSIVVYVNLEPRYDYSYNNGMNLVTCASKLKVVRGIPGQLI